MKATPEAAPGQDGAEKDLGRPGLRSGIVRMLQAAFVLLMVLAAYLVLPAFRDPEPVRVGFIGGMTGRVADFGQGGRNGAMLAVEELNAAGGIDGRPVEFIAVDDAHDAGTAEQALSSLVSRKAEAVVGPTTSTMAMTLLPAAEKAGILLVSPTVTTDELTGRDDSMVRVTASTAVFAAKNALYHSGKLGVRTVAAIIDDGNKAYARSWLNRYAGMFGSLGGRILHVEPFISGGSHSFETIVRRAAAAKPDLLLLVTNAFDAAMICQVVRKNKLPVRIACAEWASTDSLIELCGTAAEGLLMSQYYDRRSKAERFVAFQRAYGKRFGEAPGFPAIAGYEAMQVVIQALRNRRGRESLKDVILATGSFQGLLMPIVFDRNGDVKRPGYISVVRNGRFEMVE